VLAVFSVNSQEIGWEEHLENELFCVEGDVNLKVQLHQSQLTLTIS